MRSLLVTVAGLLVMTGIFAAADPDTIVSTHDGDLAAVVSQLPADHPMGTNASVTLVSLKRPPGLHEPILSTFIVTYGPGGSAVLHRSPSSGYVLVHVLSGAIRAQAWEAGMGVYLSGQTWVEPAFASDITPKNASAVRETRRARCWVTNATVLQK